MTLQPIYQQLKQQAEASQHRYLLVISGEHSWAWQQVTKIIEQHALIVSKPPQDIVATLEQLPLGHTLCQAKQATHYLGQTRQQVIFDAFHGFSADAVGAVSGTLKAGGIMVLMVPPLLDWPSFADPDYHRFLSAGTPLPTQSHYLCRWRQRLLNDRNVTIVEQHANQIELTLPHPQVNNTAPCPPPYLSQDQAQTVAAIIRVKRGRSRRPLVISADRGRGKSAALGIAASQLMDQQHHVRIIVTAPTVNHVHALFEQLKRLQPDAQHTNSQVNLGERQVHFYAPDQLLNQLPCADLLLVDEAAALPLPLLMQLDQHYPRVVYATTLHGYEGSGRGFSLKFIPHLQQHNNSVQQQHLSQPIRWATQDPLETLIFDALLLDAQLPQVDSKIPSSEFPVTMEVVSGARLYQNESLLREVFALLVCAHYQTKPSDLRAILDNHKLTIALLKQNDTLLGAALINPEGDLDQALAKQIYLGQRRPQGQLIPQVLLYQAGLEHIYKDKFARIMRIAIHPQLQQQGLGSLFYQHLKHWAQQQGFDWLGTSFGLTPDLGRFWHRQGMHFVHLGLKQDSASGCFSTIMLQALTNEKAFALEEHRALFSQQLSYHLSGSLQHLSADIASLLITTLPKQPTPPWLLEQLINVSQYPRPLASCLPLLKQWLVQHTNFDGLSVLQQAVLIARVLQQQPWHQIIHKHELAGKKRAEQLLKQSVQQRLQLELS